MVPFAGDFCDNSWYRGTGHLAVYYIAALDVLAVQYRIRHIRISDHSS